VRGVRLAGGTWGSRPPPGPLPGGEGTWVGPVRGVRLAGGAWGSRPHPGFLSRGRGDVGGAGSRDRRPRVNGLRAEREQGITLRPARRRATRQRPPRELRGAAAGEPTDGLPG